MRVETLVTLVTVITRSPTLSPTTELLRISRMLLMKTEAEVSVPWRQSGAFSLQWSRSYITVYSHWTR